MVDGCCWRALKESQGLISDVSFLFCSEKVGDLSLWTQKRYFAFSRCPRLAYAVHNYSGVQATPPLSLAAEGSDFCLTFQELGKFALLANI